MSSYELSENAKNDLEEIWLFTFENWSLEQANYYYDLILDEIQYIAENPKSGVDINKIRQTYFRSRVKSHFIYYRINNKTLFVEIIRILHQQMDLEIDF